MAIDSGGNASEKSSHSNFSIAEYFSVKSGWCRNERALGGPTDCAK